MLLWAAGCADAAVVKIHPEEAVQLLQMLHRCPPCCPVPGALLPGARSPLTCDALGLSQLHGAPGRALRLTAVQNAPIESSAVAFSAKWSILCRRGLNYCPAVRVAMLLAVCDGGEVGMDTGDEPRDANEATNPHSVRCQGFQRRQSYCLTGSHTLTHTVSHYWLTGSSLAGRALNAH